MLRRIGIVVAGAAATVVIGTFACGRVLSSFEFQDVVYDNVPSKVRCADVPSVRTVEQVRSEFPAIDDAEVLVVERCQGAVLEIQYPSHAVRTEVEGFLQKTGTWHRGSGWWWKSVPVQLRNV